MLLIRIRNLKRDFWRVEAPTSASLKKEEFLFTIVGIVLWKKACVCVCVCV
jgi:hypothetical protein